MYRPASLSFASGTWDFSRPYVAGVLNVTPDSFSDGGELANVGAAVERAHALIEAGADLLDIGGESTRPGATPVSANHELDRVVPVIEALAGAPVPLSVDTSKAVVARAAVAAGAEVVNDIAGGAFDPAILEVAAGARAYVCGHLRGTTVAEVHAREVESPGFEAVADELAEAMTRWPAALRARTIIDPGLGFGKRHDANLELCKRAGELAARLQCPVMVGPSRKRFVAELSGRAAPVGRADRDAATVGVCLAAIAGGAHIVRIHDVGLAVPAIRAFTAVWGMSR